MWRSIFPASFATFAFLNCAATFPCKAGLDNELPVTPKQACYLADAQQVAVKASHGAEIELLKAFNRPQFRAGLLEHGALELSLLPAVELLAKMKTALASMEYTSNFGISQAYRHANPGEPAMNISTINEFGRIPTMWELRAMNSSLVAGTPAREWKILEAAETGLYRLPVSSKPLPIGPNRTEALERPQYLAGNIHSRAAIGVPRYGVYAALVRNDVVRDRAVLLSTDSGGWENSCNATVSSIQPWMHIAGRLFARCGDVYAGGRDQVVYGTASDPLHTVLANTEVFGKTGGHLSRLVYELLDPKASVRRLETLMYVEAALLGPLRPQDMKLLVASFPSIFGTSDADVLRAFAAQHGVPLAWALNSGETWMEEQPTKSSIVEWMPFSPDSQPVGRARMLDPASWRLTNATAPTIATAVWAAIETEVMNLRKEQTGASNSETQKINSDRFKVWWSALGIAGGAVQPLRGDECESVDLCFGTYNAPRGKPSRDCVCRRPPPSNVVIV